MAARRSLLRSGRSQLARQKNELWYRRRLKVLAEDVKASAAAIGKLAAHLDTAEGDLAVSDRAIVRNSVKQAVAKARDEFAAPIDARRTAEQAARLNLGSTDQWWTQQLQAQGVPVLAELLPQPKTAAPAKPFGDAAPRLTAAQRRAEAERRRRVQAGLRAGTVRPLATLQIIQGQAKIQQAFNEAVETNIGLITSIPDQYFDRLEDVLFDHVATAERWESLSDKLREGADQVNDLVDYRVDLIARDQSAKMSAAFNEARSSAVGIAQYTWQTAGDERVRESHAENDGQLFSFDEGAPLDDGTLGNPGDDINCRCVALPYVEEAETEEAA